MRWPLVALGTHCTITSSKRIFAREYVDKGIPFYRSKEIIEKTKGYPISTKLYISKERYEELKRDFDTPKNGDILLTSVGTLGVPWLVDETNFYFKDGNLTWLRTDSHLLNQYLFLWLNTSSAHQQIDAKCIGSTQKALTIEALNNFLIPLPSLEEQKKICSVFRPIIEKIKLNTRINQNLEELLQSTYGEFFANNIQSADVCELNTICDYSKKKVETFTLTSHNYFSTENMSPNKMGSVDATSLPTVSLVTKCCAGSTLISNIRPYFKKILYCYEEGGCSADVLCFVPKTKNLSSFLFCTLYEDKFFNYVMAGTKGTKMPRGDKRHIMQYPIYFPNNTELVHFNIIATPILEMINQYRIENIKLTSLRDTLLPKLMSGEIDVSELDL